MTVYELERLLKMILSDADGGPSLSWDDKRKVFQIYRWGICLDNDVEHYYELAGEGSTIESCIENYRKRVKG